MNDCMDEEVTFGKYKGTGSTWRDVVRSDPGYASWLAREAAATPDDVREGLEDELRHEL